MSKTYLRWLAFMLPIVGAILVLSVRPKHTRAQAAGSMMQMPMASPFSFRTATSPARLSWPMERTYQLMPT